VARIAQYQPGRASTACRSRRCRRASADQRKGRCGGSRQGCACGSYGEVDYEGREEFTSPEILRSDLAEVILRMTDLGLGDPLEFPFIDKPAAKAVHDGYDTLVELGAVRKTGRPAEKNGDTMPIPNSRLPAQARSGTHSNFPVSRYELTEKGRVMAGYSLTRGSRAC